MWMMIDRLVKMLDSRFALKDLGTLSYFLGIQVHYLPNGILLNQRKYVDDQLHKVHPGELKPPPTSSVVGNKLSLDNPMYRSVIGARQYLSYTRLDIVYPVNQLSRYLKASTDSHWQAVKRVLRYVSGTQNYGLFIQRSEDLSLSA